jgi:hypothetical protein
MGWRFLAPPAKPYRHSRGLSALSFRAFVRVVAVDQIELMIPGPRVTTGTGEYVNRKLWSCDKPEGRAKGLFDGFVVNLAVSELLLTPGANKDPLGHMSASPSSAQMVRG